MTLPARAVVSALLAGVGARVAYALLALPSRLAGDTGRTQAGLPAHPADGVGRGLVGLRRRLAAGIVGASPTSGWLQGGTLAFVGEVLALALTAPAMAIFLVRGVAYPLVTDDASNAWGGPTMAGAWVAHLAAGFVQLGVVAAVAGLLVRPSARAALSWPG